MKKYNYKKHIIASIILTIVVYLFSCFIYWDILLAMRLPEATEKTRTAIIMTYLMIHALSYIITSWESFGDDKKNN